MNAGAAPVLGAALLVVCIAVLCVSCLRTRRCGSTQPCRKQPWNATRVFLDNREIRRCDGDNRARGIYLELSLSAVGLYGNPVRELAIAFGIAPAVVVVSYLVKYVIERAKQEFGEPRDEPSEPADPHLDF